MVSLEREVFRAYMHAACGPRVRILADSEGWPIAPGRLGHLEWRGKEAGSEEARLYAQTDRGKILARLLRLPGVHRHQIGDGEGAAWIEAGDVPTIKAVAALFQLRQRRSSSTGRSADAMALMRATSRPTALPQPSETA